ncbi:MULTISPECIES: rRNA maturation RNase YbeY [unclassified Methylophilus]|uniref:rRNA maturation RNase YbeY n=1 Tax=unclassified Methylophilus TaxID=2630143 RepID=UPI0006FAFD78|nr:MULTISPECIES: rRNA maturation RNase YbeY [unclassified Methylophilus]KQT42139.1 rRNA maturation RNase YbeY [Methylophilus sp. Leaf416]KQT56320.1 rRNA maturation RNase YbeY [Methylophilus sp. Leaf459]
MPQLDFSLQLASQENNLPTEAEFRRWVRAALRVDTSVTIRIVDAEEGRILNATYRGKDYATNVLTFPLTEHPHLMGDIVICAPVVAREAIEQGKTLLAHYAHMTVHGVLHLHGYDHEVDAQAALMESMEMAAMQKLGFANPYVE